MPTYVRTSISDTLIVIAKNIGLRKIFLAGKIRNQLFEYSFGILKDEVGNKKNKKSEIEITKNCIRLLCLICTPRTNKFYIPGETNLAERLRKRAFDSGTFTLLTLLFMELKEKNNTA